MIKQIVTQGENQVYDLEGLQVKTINGFDDWQNITNKLQYIGPSTTPIILDRSLEVHTGRVGSCIGVISYATDGTKFFWHFPYDGQYGGKGWDDIEYELKKFDEDHGRLQTIFLDSSIEKKVSYGGLHLTSKMVKSINNSVRIDVRHGLHQSSDYFGFAITNEGILILPAAKLSQLQRRNN